MKRSTDRILTTHAGALPRPEELGELLTARLEGVPYDADDLARRLDRAVEEVVQKQVECGVDVVNDGEVSKPHFSHYIRERLGGIEVRQHPPGDEPAPPSISGRDRRQFPGYFTIAGRRTNIGVHPSRVFCTGPLTYVGQAVIEADIARLRAALRGVQVEEAFLPAITPGTMEHWLRNEYYPSGEAFLYAIADALHEEYQAIVDGGFVLQVDNPDLPAAWQMHPDLDVAAFRQLAEVRIDALNHALRGIPPDRVRMHVCWGSYHGPHANDIPLREIVDLVLKVRAEGYSLEASNPRHEHEWQVWQDVKLPAGKVLIPGLVSHASDFVEHPELVAQRLERFARLVGRENVIAGTDCGLGGRVGHPEIVWAKLQALAEGARLATRRL